MMKKLALFLLAAAWAVAGFAQDRLYSDEFPLGDVLLLDGPLQRARDLNIQTLLQYDCDRLLAPYRIQAGLEPRKKAYPNWDGLDGHVGGHYLAADAGSRSLEPGSHDDDAARVPHGFRYGRGVFPFRMPCLFGLGPFHRRQRLAGLSVGQILP